jgi:cell division protein FtsW (lipid II flippase)
MKLSKSKFDTLLFLCPVILSLIGMAFIYSATINSVIAAEHTYYERQFVWLFLGMGLAMVIYFIPLKAHEVLAYVYYAIGI